MTIAYYHGAPGSFKTASMVKDWLIPSIEPPKRSFLSKLLNRPQPIFKPRHVYTNIRGVKQTNNVTVLDNKSIVNALFTAKHGSLFLIDELGQVFDGVDAKKYVHSSSSLISDENGTTEVIDTLPILFDKHRHFGYDIIGTAPSHKRVPTFFQSIAEFGYRHKAMASFGFKGFYSQAEHLGQDNGSPSQILRSQVKRMPKRVFGFYKSTATGEHKESPIKSSILLHPVFIIWIPLVIFLLVYGFVKVKEIKERRSGDQQQEQTIDDQVLPDNPHPRHSDSNPSEISSFRAKDLNQVDIQNTQASDYIDNFLSDNKSYIRLSYVGTNKAFFSFGTCEKNINLSFIKTTQSTLIFDESHNSFNYNFKTNKLKYNNEVLHYAPIDCIQDNQKEPSSLLALAQDSKTINSE